MNLFCYHVCIYYQYNKLHKLHAHIMRLIFSTTSDRAIILQDEQKWLTCSVRVKYHPAKLVFKTKCNRLPTYMNDLISFSSNSVYGLRSIARNDLNIPKSTTNYMKYFFQYYDCVCVGVSACAWVCLMYFIICFRRPQWKKRCVCVLFE